jgi:predicted nuclease of predicted toxin-antitoxin system
VTVRLLANENFPRPALLALRAAGVSVEAVVERMPAASDAAVLAYTASNGLWLVTFDRDYGELVFASKAPPPPAIVFLRQGVFAPAWPAEAVLAMMAKPEFVVGHLVVVSGTSIRRRALPPRRAE